MAYDLALNSTVFTTGKFGQCLSGGDATTASGIFTGRDKITLEAWMKTTTNPTGAIEVIAGGGGNPWIGITSTGMPRATSPSDRTIIGTTAITDGQWHHMAYCLDRTGAIGKLYVDGALIGQHTGAEAYGGGPMGVRTLPGNGFVFQGQIDEVALTNVLKYTGSFTPGSVTNLQADLIGVWHLDGDGVNSAGVVEPAATALTFSPPGSLNLNPGVASGSFSYTANGSVAAPFDVIVTDSDGGTETKQVTDLARTVSFTRSFATTGTKTVTVTNTGSGVSNPAPFNFNVTVPAPTGTVTSQPPTNGQSQRFIGTTTGTVTSGSYTLTGSNGGSTIGPLAFSVASNAFDFTHAGITPGDYTPALSVTGPGGTATVSGTSPFTILGITGDPEGPEDPGTGGNPNVPPPAFVSSRKGRGRSRARR